MRIAHIAVLGLALATTSCASIVSSSDWTVRLTSNPDGATIEVVDEAGEPVHRGTTPTVVNLSARGGYFSGEDYTVRARAPGHPDGEKALSSRLNGWYFGNIVFGGAIGLLIVDPATGAMWRLPERLHIDLVNPEPEPVREPSRWGDRHLD